MVWVCAHGFAVLRGTGRNISSPSRVEPATRKQMRDAHNAFDRATLKKKLMQLGSWLGSNGGQSVHRKGFTTQERVLTAEAQRCSLPFYTGEKGGAETPSSWLGRGGAP